MTSLKLDSSGRLLELAAIPPHREENAPSHPPSDPATLFTAAGLDFKTFQPATPQWTGLVDNDQRTAWVGPFPGRPDWIVRVEAAWWHGQPVFFRVIPPWASAPRAAPTRSLRDRLRDYSNLAQSLVFLVGAGLLAWQNWSKGRGDRQGAFRLAAFAFVVGFSGYLLDSHSLFSDKFFRVAGAAAGSSLWAALTLWLAYLALEPPVRRQWPQILISWTRVLTGRWRDALVAQHALAGILVGLGWCLTFTALIFAGEWLGGAPQASGDLVSFSGLRFTSGEILDQVIGSLRTALAFFITLFVLRLLVRKEWIAAVLFVLVNVAMRSLPNDHPLVLVPPFLIIFSLIVVVLIRFGLLSVVFAIVTVNTLNSLVVTTNFSAWYGNGSLFVLVLFALLCVVAYRQAAVSPSGKPIQAG